MLLKDLLKNIDCDIYYNGNENIDITGLTHESSKVKDKNIFICLRGVNFDGQNYVYDAISNGARVIASEKQLSLPDGVSNLVVKDTRKFMALLASNFYGNPSKYMKIVSVTGTNGKTTTTYMIESICKSAGFKTGIIGTNGVFVDGQKFETNMTTPDPIDLQNILHIMKNKGVEIVAMEMSAHALELQKNSGVMSDIAVFTNLTQDHLDYFKTMENYGKAKKKLFTEKASRFAVINVDDEFSDNLINDIKIPYVTTSINRECDFFANSIKNENNGQSYILSHKNEDTKININLDGRFNVQNSLGAIAVAKRLGITNDKICEGLKNLKAVPGRFNSFNIGGKKFIVDYAHTPDGLENILNATRQILNNDGKLISIFGCGGNRDALKRPIMGEISSRLADITIITSDNPRFEYPLDIIGQIEKGIDKGNEYYIEPDRRKAIKLGFNIAKTNDIIVVSGKGAEDYMDKCGKKTHFSDSEEIINLGSEK